MTLSDYGRVFATRDKAREVLAESAWQSSRRAELDLSGVSVSPSFMAEALRLLTSRYTFVAVRGADAHTLDLVRSLAEKLGVSGQVKVEPSPVPA